MEISHPRTLKGEDFDQQLRDAELEMERIQRERDDLARKKIELEELTKRKRGLLSQQAELLEKISSSITLIERELYSMRQEGEDLEQTRACFATHLERLNKINPEQWTPANQVEKIEKASILLDLAADDYDQASAHFQNGRSAPIFGHGSSRKNNHPRRGEASDFMRQLQSGFAFNLPIITLGGIALIIYFIK